MKNVFVDPMEFGNPHGTILVANCKSKPRMNFVMMVKDDATDEEIRAKINNTAFPMYHGRVIPENRIIRRDRNWVKGYGWKWEDWEIPAKNCS